MHEMYDDWLRIAFIGGGDIAETIFSSLLAKGKSRPQDIFVSDADENRCQYIKEKYVVTVMSDNRMARFRGDLVVLDIKPQNLTEVMNELRGKFDPYQLVLSVIAGVTITALSSDLAYDHIVRVISNNSDQIGEGTSQWTATSKVSYEQRMWASSILGTIGKEIYVDDEKSLDLVVI
jgi:pyrroline-5-carboxylate reductase